ncbi:MAG: hypothetical protein L0216_13025 [Planctomycetales bacterium]|nr:hypothetical protein [Planctomycetales bacterium]
MIARRTVWCDPRVKDLVARFVPCADEVYGLQSGTGPECELFRKIAEQGHYAGRTKPSNTRQGTYAAAPSGRLLASVNSNDPARMARMLRDALAAWEKLPREERLLPGEPAANAENRLRWEQRYPADGLVLRVHTRDLPRAEDAAREGSAKDWRAAAWNQDFAWFTRDEARRLLPEDPAAGAARAVPESLVRRLARCHLLDDVRGQTSQFDERHVARARLESSVVRHEGNLVGVRLEGETRTSSEGKWRVHGLEERSVEKQSRGFEARLLGRAVFDLSAGRFVRFELLAVGTRWGGTQYNCRQDDLAPAPMGVALTLAGDSPAERVAPAFVWAYGWK